jgi:RNA-binding protein
MERDEREAALIEICKKLDAQAVQHIGKVLVLFRPRPKDATPA